MMTKTSINNDDDTRSQSHCGSSSAGGWPSSVSSTAAESTLASLGGCGVGNRKPKKEKRFDVSKVSFFGRSHELDQLKELYHQVTRIDSNQPPHEGVNYPAAFVWGLSGTGKSHLVQQFFSELVGSDVNAGVNEMSKGPPTAGAPGEHNDDNHNATTAAPAKSTDGKFTKPYIIQGKHDEHTGFSDPFSAIIQALTGFCNHVTQNEPPQELDRIKASINAAVKDEGKSIIRMVPAFRKLFGGFDAKHSDTASVDSNTSSQTFLGMAGDDHHHHHHEMFAFDHGATDMAQNRLRYTFLALIKAIATKERPLILFLDDLQWSSDVTMDLVRMLLSDKSLHNFLLVGTVRQDLNPHTEEVMELDSNAPVSFMLRSLQEEMAAAAAGAHDPNTKQGNHVCTENPHANHVAPWLDIHLSNLSLQDTQQLLATCLDQPSDAMAELSSTIYHKTQGNVYYIMQIVNQIRNNPSKAGGTNCMGYNSNIVNQASGVVDLIASRIDQLKSPKLRTALIIASYIQFTFDVETLRAALEALSEHSFDSFKPFQNEDDASPVDKVKLERLLDKAVLDGLLSHTIGSTSYNFHHDRVQQAAKSLVVGEDRTKLKYRLGLCLLGIFNSESGDDTKQQEPALAKKKNKKATNMPATTTATKTLTTTTSSSVKNKSSLLFIAVDHLNSISSKDHRFLLELNTKVAERTMDLGALSSASKYGEIAFAHLDKIRDPWTNQYDLTMRLHRVNTNAELALGNYEAGYKLGDELCKHSKTSIDALPTIISKAVALSTENKRTQSIEFAVQAAQSMLGEYPKRGVVWTIIKELVWIKSYFRRHNDKDILDMPLMTDAKHLLSMKLLSQIIGSALQNGRITEWLVATVKSIRLTIKHGICEHAALALMLLGLLCVGMGDNKGATRFANLSTSILERTNGESTKGFVHIVCPTTIYRWSESSVFCMSMMHQGYHGMR